MKYRKAAVGGTFDHFHAGHKQLVRTALQSADQVVIGITNQQLVIDKPLSHLIETYQQRQQNVLDFIRQEQAESTADVVQLADSFGPTLTDPDIDVLVVSEMTARGAEMVNQHRVKAELPALPILVTPMVSDEAGDYISSTAIRQGKISRNGRVFKKLFQQDIVFTPSQMASLKPPQGNTFSMFPSSSATRIFLIGDQVTKYAVDQGINFTFSITDGMTERKPINFILPNIKKIPLSNKPGTINSQLAQELIVGFSQDPAGTIYQIDGEEDLLAFIPCLTECLGTVVLYGQPEGGIVMITLTEANKLHFAQFIDPTFS